MSEAATAIMTGYIQYSNFNGQLNPIQLLCSWQFFVSFPHETVSEERWLWLELFSIDLVDSK